MHVCPLVRMSPDLSTVPTIRIVRNLLHYLGELILKFLNDCQISNGLAGLTLRNGNSNFLSGRGLFGNSHFKINEVCTGLTFNALTVGEEPRHPQAAKNAHMALPP